MTALKLTSNGSDKYDISADITPFQNIRFSKDGNTRYTYQLYFSKCPSSYDLYHFIVLCSHPQLPNLADCVLI